VRVLERRGLLIADPVHPQLDFEPGSSLDHLQAASIQSRIAIGPHAGRKALTLYSVPPLEETADRTPSRYPRVRNPRCRDSALAPTEALENVRVSTLELST
jgi:hypothetical protein